MKTNTSPQVTRFVTLVLAAAMGALPLTHAANGTWTSNATGNWSTGPWTGGTPNASTDVATFRGLNWTGQVITVDTPITVGTITANDTVSGGGLTISGGTLTLAGSAIINSGADSNFSESAATRLKISSVLDGTSGFERQGSGYLDLSGATNTFTGTIRLTAPTVGGGSFTVINSDANLGNASNVITAATAAQPVGFYNDAAAGSFTLNSARTITTTGTGDFWVKNKSGANMTIAGVISGTANFRKNDTGTVTLTGANSYALATKLEGGTLRLSGGTNRLPTTTTVQFLSSSTLDLTNTTQSVAAISPFGGVTNTITGAGGSLTVTNNANFTVNAADATVLDMSGLTNFTYNQPTKDFIVRPVTSGTSANNTINLAKAGTNAITALNITVGGATGTSQGTAHEGRLTLGTVNNFNATNVTLGGFNGSGKVSFQSGLTTPVLTLRGLTGGSSAVTLWKVGETSSGTRSGAGVFDLTGGSLDAIVTDLVINRHIASATNGITSSFTMPAGFLVSSTILLGEKTATGTPVITTNFNQGGGTVKVSTLTFGKEAAGGATPDFRSSYNLSGGTLSAATIEAGTGAFATTSVRRFGWTGGTIANFDASTNLSINGVSGTGGSIILATSTAAAKAFDVSANRTITLGANTSLTGNSDLTKSGNGSLIFASGATHTYSGAFGITGGTVVVDSGANIGTAAITIGSGATFRVNGSISNAITVNGGTVTGSGTLGVNLGLNALADVVSPGNSPGIQNFGVSQTWSSFTYDWELNDWSAGTAGSTFDQIAITGSLDLNTGISGTPFEINLLSLTGGNASGLVGGTFSESSISWTVVSTTGGITGFVPAKWLIDTTAFSTSSGFTGTFSMAVNGNNLDLTYTPIPEPSAYAAMVGLGVVSLALYRRRRQSVRAA